ncbi:MAG: phosphoribosylformylglycinamidine cyclo-ligase [Desulfatibacillaceae bacterium]|nr:phosphoribosylformylglycinamidine cyclo-ligase [Desulfatibacillaceae bacterium]
MKKSLSYADAGVDIDKGNRLVDIIKDIVKTTPRHGVMGDIGGFGGLFSLNTSQYDRPVLVSSTDGVGTKLKIAIMADKHDTVGIDLVAMVVNDIAVQGAKPLFFLDYIAMGKLNLTVATQILQGIAEGCRQANCPLIGGETAEMPGMYQESDYDLAGFGVGIVDNFSIIDGSMVGVGNQLIGMGSSGLHSNGYSLVRKICFEHNNYKIDSFIEELGTTLGEALLTPTRIYSETILKTMRQFPIHGLANITGGGLVDNLPRTLPKSCKGVIRKGSWESQPIFRFLQREGNVSDAEMLRTFNCGLGMVAAVPKKTCQETVDMLNALGEKAWIIGEVREMKEEGPRVEWEE